MTGTALAAEIPLAQIVCGDLGWVRKQEVRHSTDPKGSKDPIHRWE